MYKNVLSLKTIRWCPVQVVSTFPIQLRVFTTHKSRINKFEHCSHLAAAFITLLVDRVDLTLLYIPLPCIILIIQ
jgi:hypothetical protein